MPSIEIDGRALEVEAGKMIIQAADAAGIYIPRFCYHEKLSIAANCRMCLVEVEKAPKPLPACATPVQDGMKVFTRSALAVEAQKGTMEFLLINHPLDCPICDQGGECPLQDQALGYGGDVSRYSESKRVVDDPDIGPLIETEMTRCIHCTRCVRFGQEIAGVMEFGASGRTEDMKIGPFVGRTVDSELSGNVIDLCPVGALTSKPYRFTARSWELVSREGVSPHDCVGSNLTVQSLRNRVKRVLPRDNEAVNECWLSDRDRFSYEAINSDDRLTTPMIREHGEWKQVDWPTALGHAADRLARVVAEHGPESVGALASPTATLEEFFLLQKLVRALGSGNVDHRLRQLDFSDDAAAPRRPGLGLPIAELERVGAALLVGSNIRKEQPLLGLRLRKASLAGARIMALNAMDYEFHFELAARRLATPSRLPQALAGIARALAERRAAPLPEAFSAWLPPSVDAAEAAIAETLHGVGEEGVIVLGSSALSHPRAAALHAMAQWLAQASGARLGMLPEANAAAAWMAGCVPHRGPGGVAAEPAGSNVAQMLRNPRQAYLLLGLEPELDCLESRAARAAMRAAGCVVSLSAFAGAAVDYADVWLPIATFAETPGTYVSCEGRVQSVAAAVPPPGEARPAWKVLRVLGNLLELSGFDYVSCADVRAEVPADDGPLAPLLASWQLGAPDAAGEPAQGELERIGEVPMYAVDPLVRRAGALQRTADNPAPAVGLNAGQAAALGLSEGVAVEAHLGASRVRLRVVVDRRVPDGCAFVPGGHAETADLDGPGIVRLARL